MKETQTTIRFLWTILTLLKGGKNQTELIKQLNIIDYELQKRNTDLIKTNKAKQSPILKELERKKIAEFEYEDIEGSNFKYKKWTIPNYQESLVNILTEINKKYIKKPKKNYFIRQIMNSYLKEQINTELVPDLLNKQNIEITYSPDEKEFIKKILRISPQSLIFTVTSIQNQDRIWKQHNAKNLFLHTIQTLLNLDLLDNYIKNTKAGSRTVNIKIKTEISFNESDNIPELKQNITPEKSQFTSLQNIKIESTQTEVEEYTTIIKEYPAH